MATKVKERPADVVGNFEDPANISLMLYAKLYYYLAKEMVDTFGEQGEQALRRAIRAFGQDRGRTLRKKHMQMGLEINVKNLFTHYDLPSGQDHDSIRNRIQLDEENRVSQTFLCYLQCAWDEAGGDIGNKLGSIYCDEFHWSMWSAYDRDITVELPFLLTKKHPFCLFEVHRQSGKPSEEPKGE